MQNPGNRVVDDLVAAVLVEDLVEQAAVDLQLTILRGDRVEEVVAVLHADQRVLFAMQQDARLAEVREALLQPRNACGELIAQAIGEGLGVVRVLAVPVHDLLDRADAVAQRVGDRGVDVHAGGHGADQFAVVVGQRAAHHDALDRAGIFCAKQRYAESAHAVAHQKDGLVRVFRLGQIDHGLGVVNHVVEVLVVRAFALAAPVAAMVETVGADARGVELADEIVVPALMLAQAVHDDADDLAVCRDVLLGEEPHAVVRGEVGFRIHAHPPFLSAAQRQQAPVGIVGDDAGAADGLRLLDQLAGVGGPAVDLQAVRVRVVDDFLGQGLDLRMDGVAVVVQRGLHGHFPRIDLVGVGRDARMIQIAGEDVAVQRLEPLQDAHVEAGDDHAVDDVILLQDGVELFQRGVLIAGKLLDLDVDDLHVLDDVQHLLQRGRGLAAVAIVVRMEAAAEVVLGDLVIGHLIDLAGAVGRAIDGLVVANHEHAILAQVDVALDAVGLHCHGHPESSQRVFGRVAGRASMSLYHNHFLYASSNFQC